MRHAKLRKIIGAILVCLVLAIFAYAEQKGKDVPPPSGPGKTGLFFEKWKADTFIPLELGYQMTMRNPDPRGQITAVNVAVKYIKKGSLIGKIVAYWYFDEKGNPVCYMCKEKGFLFWKKKFFVRDLEEEQGCIDCHKEKQAV